MKQTYINGSYDDIPTATNEYDKVITTFEDDTVSPKNNGFQTSHVNAYPIQGVSIIIH